MYGGRVQQITVCPPLNVTPSATTPVPDTPVTSHWRTSLNVFVDMNPRSLHLSSCCPNTFLINRAVSIPNGSAYFLNSLDNNHDNAPSYSRGEFRSRIARSIIAYVISRHPFQQLLAVARPVICFSNIPCPRRCTRPLLAGHADTSRFSGLTINQPRLL